MAWQASDRVSYIKVLLSQIVVNVFDFDFRSLGFAAGLLDVALVCYSS